MADLGALPLLITAFTGGAAGAVITAIATSRRSQRDLGIKLAEKYIEMFDKIAEAKTMLRDPNALDTAANRNAVANVANWLEIVASCYLNELADSEILRSLGLPQLALRFYREMSEAMCATENGSTSLAFGPDRLVELKHLNRLAQGEAPRCSI